MRLSIPASWNVFSSESGFNSDFFSRSPYRSLDFVTSTVLLILDLAGAVLIGWFYWSYIPLKGLYVVMVIALPIVWIRMRLDHRKMSNWVATATPELVDSYPVRMASHLMKFSMYYVYFIFSFLLFFYIAALVGQTRALHGSVHPTQTQAMRARRAIGSP